ncbi:transglutaminaseTgpA domain-containing protein [Nocardioides sp. TRM66260-LWL]|uniref:transglutaminaseTgpA domain-containing protein n=1 Tax=Nocardioides sp. TRM66260-LWL TaxID=2874478 RepID=UPI001CC5FBEC|nr:transglutaminaseTgpA domain-containing protein [Nocardioides sp. TRM66260-LWL]MBZ5733336.1 transglutaminaseTgpA domain-containing protein [Nocardioides sp. TRM66260-LWL]
MAAARSVGAVRPARLAAPALLGRSLLATLTGWLALLSWSAFAQQPAGYLRPLLWIAVVLALTGTAQRLRTRVPWPLVVIAQTCVGALGVTAVALGHPWVLSSADAARLAEQWRAAVASAQTYAPPVAADVPPIDLVMVAGGTALLVVIELLVGTARRTPLVALPLLGAVAVPLAIVGDTVPWWQVLLVALGLGALLLLHERDTAGRWGPRIGGADDHRPTTVRTTALLIGGSTAALALVLPLALPGVGTAPFGLGSGPGRGGSGVSVTNPMTDLQRDLRRGADVPLVQVRTAEPDPSYLRIAVLTTFNGERWTAGDRAIPDAQRADGQPIPLSGVDADVPRTARRWSVDVGDFSSRWLPTASTATEVTAEGDWRYDVATGDVIAADDDLDTRDLSYSFVAQDLRITAADLAAAGPPGGAVSSSFTRLPDDLPPIVQRLTDQLTEGATDDFEIASRLQAFFQDEFTYDLEQAPVGNGVNALAAFLEPTGPDARRGYCEQFASAMAVMARLAGIPARVAVGFLRPERLGPGVYEYSSHDLHAWPELFFRGYGWVRFEPTPTVRTDTVPGYSVQRDGGPSQPPSTAPSAQPSARPSAAPSQAPEQRREQTPAPSADAPVAAGSSPLPRVLSGAAIVLAVVGLVLLPRSLRRRRRRRRLAGDPEQRWAEVGDTARDVGAPWPPARSPRETAAALAPTLAPEARAALDALTLEVERGRYAGSAASAARGTASDSATSSAATVVAALLRDASPRARRRATWLPVTPLRHRAAAPVAATAEDAELVSSARRP